MGPRSGWIEKKDPNPQTQHHKKETKEGRALLSRFAHPPWAGCSGRSPAGGAGSLRRQGRGCARAGGGLCCCPAPSPALCPAG